jgi:hypothetical protein
MFPDHHFRQILKISLNFYPSKQPFRQKFIKAESEGSIPFLALYISHIHYFIIFILTFLSDFYLPVHKILHVFDEVPLS